MDLSAGELQGLISELSHFLGQVLLAETLTAGAEDARASLLQRLAEVAEAAQEAPPLPPGPRPPHLNGSAIEAEDLYDAPESSAEDEYEEFPGEVAAAAPPLPPVPPAVPAKLLAAKAAAPESEAGSDAGLPLPAEAVTASALRASAAKHGPLYRKERFIFVEQFRRCWAAVGAHYLFLFSSDKESKPSASHLLLNYEARPAPHFVKDAKKKEFCFELVSPGRKSYQFIARTQKDMHQWVAAINDEAKRKVSVGNVAANPAEVPLQTSPVPEVPLAQNKRNSSAHHKRARRLPSLPSSESDGYNEAVGESSLIEDDSASSASEVQYEMMNSDEEIYYNIDDVQPSNEPPAAHQQPSSSEPARGERPTMQKQENKLKQTPLPAEAAMQDDEDQYDDVLALQDKDSYYDFSAAVEVPPPPAVVSLVPQPNQRPQQWPPEAPQEEEDLYDDVMTEREDPPVQQPSWRDKEKANKITPPPQSSKPTIAGSKFPIPPAQSTKPIISAQALKPSLPLQPSKPFAAKLPLLPSPAMKPTGPIKKLALSTFPLKSYKPMTPVKTPTAPKLNTVPSQANKPVTSLKPTALPKQNMKPTPANTFKNSNSGHIKNLIKQMEASMGEKPSPEVPNVSAGPQNNSGSAAADDFYEPVDQDDFSPQLPPRPN